MYFIGKGDLYIADVDASLNPGPFTNCGETPLFDLEPSTDYADNFATNKSAPNEQDLHLAIKRSLAVSITIKEKTAFNLALFLHGQQTVETSGVQASMALGSTVAAGDIVLVPGGQSNISALVVKDSTPTTPATLAPGTDYKIIDAKAGLVQIISIGSYLQPFKFAYSYGGRTIVSMLSKAIKNKAILFAGKNLVDDSDVVVRLHNISLMPASKISLKGDEVNSYELKGVALINPNAAEDAALGRYGAYSTLT
jgi:hypothetical protein